MYISLTIHITESKLKYKYKFLAYTVKKIKSISF